MDISDETIASLVNDIERAIASEPKAEIQGFDKELICKYKDEIRAFVVALVTSKLGGYIGDKVDGYIKGWFASRCN